MVDKAQSVTGSSPGGGEQTGAGSVLPPVQGPPRPPDGDRSFVETPLNRLAAYSVLVGIITGLLVALLNKAILFTENAVYGTDHLHRLDPAANIPRGQLALTLVVVGFVLSWFWWVLSRYGSAIVSPQAAMGGKKMPLVETIVGAFVAVMAVAAGAPVGRENAPRLLGALGAARVCDRMRLDRRTRRILVASAAGAGLGASFHLPLAGALFALELLLVEMTTRTVVATMLVSATAVGTTGLFIEPHPIYHTVALTEDFSDLVVAAIVGFVAGIAGHLFGKMARRAVARHTTGVGLLWQIPAAFGVVAVVAYFVPGVSGNGRWAADTAFTVGLPVGTLLLIGLFRGGLAILCFRVGTVGGTLTPAFSLGAVVGSLLGVGLAPLFPDVPAGAFALLGAAAFLSTTMAAPMFGMIAAVEFTDMAAQGYLSMFVAVVSAALAVRVYGLLINADQRHFPLTIAAWTKEEV